MPAASAVFVARLRPEIEPPPHAARHQYIAWWRELITTRCPSVFRKETNIRAEAASHGSAVASMTRSQVPSLSSIT
jgi:hypothetical protein